MRNIYIVSTKKNNSSKIIFVIIGLVIGLVLIIIIIVLIVLYKKNIICRKKNELNPSKNSKSIQDDPSETKSNIFNGEEKIKVIFNDNKNRYEIYADPETTMEELIAVYYSENNIKIKINYFYVEGKIY
jgi:hypothetical protein